MDPKSLPNFSILRGDFPMLSKQMQGCPLIYLDSAATAQKPQIVIDTLTDFYTNHYATVHRAVYSLAAHSTEQYHEVRNKAQRFLNAAKNEEIIFTRGTTESINLIATSFGKAFLQPGDEIVISEIEHHSNIVPWQLVCEERGCSLKVVSCNPKGELNLEHYAQLLSQRTKIVSFSHISNSLGTLNPIRQLISMAHEVGAKILIDAAQSAPHLALDVQALDVDFLVFSGHKLYGPTGVGVLYGKEELLERMPPYQGGGDMIEQVNFTKTTYNILPLKFEAGTPMIAEVIGLGAALDYVTTIGLSHIQLWEHTLLEYATKKLIEMPEVTIIGTAAEKGAIISFVVEGLHALDLGMLLDLKGIAVRTGHHCAQPVMRYFNIPATVRLSFALYNTLEEMDYFIAALKKCIKMLS